MDGLFEMLAAPRPHTVLGKEYLLCPPTLTQRAELEHRMMADHPTPLEVVRTMLKELTGRDREFLLEMAFQETRWGGRPTMAQFERWLLTYEGSIRMLACQLDKHHPGMTLEQVEMLMRAGGIELIIASRETMGKPVGNSGSRPTAPAATPKADQSLGDPSSAPS